MREKRVSFVIPADLTRYHIVARNLTPNITTERSVNAAGDSVLTYVARNLTGFKEEERAPEAADLYPCLLVVGEFADCQDLYRWYRDAAQVDCTLPDGDRLIADITAGCGDDLARIAATYSWVQRNIRYIAFEAGIEGHRPDRPAEVLRKRYGDCKGMALLLRTLLRAQGFDARLSSIGTRNIPFAPTTV